MKAIKSYNPKNSLFPPKKPKISSILTLTKPRLYCFDRRERIACHKEIYSNLFFFLSWRRVTFTNRDSQDCCSLLPRVSTFEYAQFLILVKFPFGQFFHTIFRFSSKWLHKKRIIWVEYDQWNFFWFILNFFNPSK